MYLLLGRQDAVAVCDGVEDVKGWMRDETSILHADNTVRVL